MRAAPAHSSAVSAPPIVPVHAQPRKNGAASENTAKSGNSRLMIATSLSRTRSGAKRSADVAFTLKSQPMCAWKKPRNGPANPLPSYSWGECGSPGRSLNTWCRRWFATQPISEPSIASDPALASAILSAAAA